MSDPGEAFPLTNDEVRRRRLRQLVLDPANGGLEAIAVKCEVDARNLDHILKRRRQWRKDVPEEKRPFAMVGDALARQIEARMDLPTGWMDWPFLNVPYELVARLGATGRALVEGAMLNTLRNLPAVIHQTDRAPVSDKDVEDSFGRLSPDEVKSAHARAHLKMRSSADPSDPALRQRALDLNQPPPRPK